MRLLIMSDLHLEFHDTPETAPWMPEIPRPNPDSYDVVVLAGDIHEGKRGVDWAQRTFRQKPVIYVPGNHEFYDRHLFATLKLLRETASRSNVHLLNNNEVELHGVRILGSILWTDFELYNDSYAAQREARFSMRDFSVIRFAQGERFTPARSIEQHTRSVKWLRERLQRPFLGKTIVVTHHLPSEHCVSPLYQGHSLSPAFASKLDALMEGPSAPELWIHGHTHDSVDTTVGRTRVVCNPMGYYPHALNPEFRPDLVIEV